MKKAVLEEVIQVSESPGDKAETCDAEEGVEDLGIDFQPDPSGGVEVVAVFDSVQTGGVAHVLVSTTNKEKKEHSSPSDDVQTVDYHDESEGGNGVFAKAYEADFEGFCSREFGRKFVAVGIHSIRVGTLIRGRLGSCSDRWCCGGGCTDFGGNRWWFLEFFGQRPVLVWSDVLVVIIIIDSFGSMTRGARSEHLIRHFPSRGVSWKYVVLMFNLRMRV